MAEVYKIGTFEQIETILSKLANNYSEIARLFYDIFYNDVPGDYEIQLYDEAGNLQTYQIPNRAKDRAYILNGNGNPEGAVAAPKGSIYQDLTDGTLYIKKNSDDNQGWIELISKDELENVLIQGLDSPEGVQEALRGTLYTDISSASLYIKSTPAGKSGWILIGGTEDNPANIDLSNLSVLGRAKFTAKENVSNKVTTISSLSTDDQYPSAKCVYDLLGDVENLLSDV